MTRTNSHVRKQLFIPAADQARANTELENEGWPGFFSIACVDDFADEDAPEDVTQYAASGSQVLNDVVRVVQNRLGALEPAIPVSVDPNDLITAMFNQGAWPQGAGKWQTSVIVRHADWDEVKAYFYAIGKQGQLESFRSVVLESDSTDRDPPRGYGATWKTGGRWIQWAEDFANRFPGGEQNRNRMWLAEGDYEYLQETFGEQKYSEQGDPSEPAMWVQLKEEKWTRAEILAGPPEMKPGSVDPDLSAPSLELVSRYTRNLDLASRRPIRIKQRSQAHGSP